MRNDAYIRIKHLNRNSPHYHPTNHLHTIPLRFAPNLCFTFSRYWRRSKRYLLYRPYHIVADDDDMDGRWRCGWSWSRVCILMANATSTTWLLRYFSAIKATEVWSPISLSEIRCLWLMRFEGWRTCKWCADVLGMRRLRDKVDKQLRRTQFIKIPH